MKEMCAQGKSVSCYSSKPIPFALTVHSVDILNCTGISDKTGDMINWNRPKIGIRLHLTESTFFGIA